PAPTISGGSTPPRTGRPARTGRSAPSAGRAPAFSGETDAHTRTGPAPPRRSAARHGGRWAAHRTTPRRARARPPAIAAPAGLRPRDLRRSTPHRTGSPPAPTAAGPGGCDVLRQPDARTRTAPGSTP